MCKKHIYGTYNCPTDALCAICCRHLAARPHDQTSSPAQFVLLISHSIQNVMQCKELFNYNVVYAACQYVVIKKKPKPEGRTSIHGLRPCIVRSARLRPGLPKVRAVCVAPLRTRGCAPCAALRLSLHPRGLVRFGSPAVPVSISTTLTVVTRFSLATIRGHPGQSLYPVAYFSHCPALYILWRDTGIKSL